MKIGDELTRMLGGSPVKVKVVSIADDGKTFKVGTPEFQPSGDAEYDDGCLWTFDTKTGAEIDDYFGWGPPPKITGSFIPMPGIRAVTMSDEESKREVEYFKQRRKAN